MAIRRKKTLQELLSSIGAGAAPVYSGNVNLQRASAPISPYFQPKYPSIPGYGGEQNPFISKPSPVLPGKVPQDYSPSLLDPYQAKLEEDRLGAIDPTKPYGPQDDSVYEQDRVPRYSAVVDPRTLEQVSPGLNPYVFSQMTGKPSRTDYDSYIELLTARHPNFASEYRANPIGAIEKYETSSGLAPDLIQAQQYHAGTLGDVNTLLTPQMMEQSFPMLANFPGMRPMIFQLPADWREPPKPGSAEYRPAYVDYEQTGGTPPLVPALTEYLPSPIMGGGLLTADQPADPLGIGPLGSGGLLGQV